LWVKGKGKGFREHNGTKSNIFEEKFRLFGNLFQKNERFGKETKA
jgi:hypothetical protein